MQPSDYIRRQRHLDWLAEIYRAYAPGLQRYIASKVSDPALAEDLTATVFLKALRWLKEDQSKESARGWLYATARTTIVDHWQTFAHYETRPLSGLEEQLFSAEDSFASQAEQRVQRLLSLLPERERTVLTLRYLQGCSAAEIAGALGTSAGHIRVVQLRALRHAAHLERAEREGSTMQEQQPVFDKVIQILPPECRRVLNLARDEAVTLRHNFIGTEHLLWGLTSEGCLTAFFAPLGVEPERIHAGIVFIFDRHAPQIQQMTGKGPSPDADPLSLLTPRARMTLILAGEEARSQGEKNIRPAHLLLGLMNEGEGIGAGLLRSLSISLLQARSVLSPATANQLCAFCGRTGSQVKHLFPAEVGLSTDELTPPTTFICDQCVTRFHSMLESA